jgi:hypothetical protein
MAIHITPHRESSPEGIVDVLKQFREPVFRGYMLKEKQLTAWL